MIRWQYRGVPVAAVGLLLAAFSFAAVAGCSLLESGIGARSGDLGPLLPGAFLVRSPRAGSPAAVLSGAARSLPLAASPACLSLLQSQPAVASVLPFSVGRLELSGDLPDRTRIGTLTAIALSDTDWPAWRARLAAGSIGLPFSLAGGIVLSDSALSQASAAASRPVAAGRRFYLDAPGGSGPFNLTAVALAGSFAVTTDRSPAAVSRVCFIGRESLLRASWRSLAALAAIPGSATLPAPAPPPAKSAAFIEKLAPGSPLAYPFLFSLDSAFPPQPLAASEPYPDYILVSLTPAALQSKRTVLAQLQDLFEKNRLEAAIENWDPTAAEADWPPFAPAGGLILAAALLALIALANLALTPVVRSTAPETMETDGRRAWRPSFLSHHAFIGLTYGAIGTLWALILIFLHNLFAPPVLHEIMAAVLGTRVETLRLGWTGPATAGVGILLFIFTSWVGPRRKARRLAESLRAADRPLGGAGENPPPPETE